mgnify:CR=1 FL=1
MAYRQDNSPFKGPAGYRDPKRTSGRFDVTKLRAQPPITVDKNQTANGGDDSEEISTSEDGQNQVAGEGKNMADKIAANRNDDTADVSMGKAGRIQKMIDDPNTNPSKRVRLEDRQDQMAHRADRINELGEIKNARKALARDTREERRLQRGKNKQQRILNRQLKRGVIKEEQIPEFQEQQKEVNWRTYPDAINEPSQQTDEEYYDRGDYENSYGGTAMYKKDKNMKQINRRGSAFPMVGDQADPTAIQNRAGKPAKELVNDPTNPQPDDKVSAQNANNAQMMSNIASSAGTPHQQAAMLNTDDNNQDQIAAAQNTLGEATNTVGDGVGTTFGGAPAKKGKVELDGKEVSYNKGGMRENLTAQGKIKSGGKITKQIWKNAEEGDYGSLAEKQANFSKNAFGFTGTSMEGPAKTMGPHEDPFSIPTPKKEVAQDKSSVQSDRTRKTLHGTKRVIKATDQHGKKIKMTSKDKKNKRVLKGNF